MVRSAFYCTELFTAFSVDHFTFSIFIYRWRRGNILRARVSTTHKSWRRYLFLGRENGRRMLSAGIACCWIKRSGFHGRSIKRSTVERTPLSGSDGAERNVSSIPCASLITATLYLDLVHPAHTSRVCSACLRSFPCPRALRDSYITILWIPDALLSFHPVIILSCKCNVA